MRGAPPGSSDSTPQPAAEEGAAPARQHLQATVDLSTMDLPAMSSALGDAANEDFLFHLYRGSELLQDNRVEEAKEELERALRVQPHDAKGQDLLGIVYFRLGLYPRAIAIYEDLRSASPEDPALLLNLALCYLKTGKAALARRDLEQLVSLDPSHARAWGYLGLACERLGALREAQYAFTQGGHDEMAGRIASRRASQTPPQAIPESKRSREVREVAAAAYEELDAGVLSFALAEPVSEPPAAAADNWHPVEPGQAVRRAEPRTLTGPDAFGAVAPETLAALGGATAESEKPDTKDGPPPVKTLPPPDAGGAVARRNTLTVGVAPPQRQSEVEALKRLAAPNAPKFAVDEGAPSMRAHARIPAVRVGVGAPAPLDDLSAYESTKRTLPPPVMRAPTPPPAPPHSRPASAPPGAGQLTRDSILDFPAAGHVVLHPSGVALVHTAEAEGFATRLEAVRASSNALSMKLLERQVKGKPTGESFGGVGSPLVHATGEGQLVLAPRPGRKLSSFTIENDMCFVREEVLLGFDGALAFENGRLATGEGEFVGVVQLRGRGAVLLEAIGEILTLQVRGRRGLSVRREVVLGWFGRLVPRALAPNDAPCGQRGLVSFAGEGRVLVASA